MPKIKKKDYKKLEMAVIAVVLLVGIGAVYLMYQVNTGKAFYTSPQIEVVQSELQFCCCQTEAGRYYEVFGSLLKNSDDSAKRLACIKTCEVDHSTPDHPSKLFNVGKCGENPRLI